MARTLEGRVAVVTGGAGGIGEAVERIEPCLAKSQPMGERRPMS